MDVQSSQEPIEGYRVCHRPRSSEDVSPPVCDVTLLTREEAHKACADLNRQSPHFEWFPQWDSASLMKARGEI